MYYYAKIGRALNSFTITEEYKYFDNEHGRDTYVERIKNHSTDKLFLIEIGEAVTNGLGCIEPKSK